MGERNGFADCKQHLLDVSCSDADLSTMPLRRLRTLKLQKRQYSFSLTYQEAFHLRFKLFQTR